MPYDASSEPISKRFIEGLQQYDLTLKEIRESGLVLIQNMYMVGISLMNVFVVIR